MMYFLSNIYTVIYIPSHSSLYLPPLGLFSDLSCRVMTEQEEGEGRPSAPTTQTSGGAGVGAGAGEENGRPRVCSTAAAPSVDFNPNKFLSWSESSLWGRWTFSLVTPLVALGLTRTLRHADLIPVDERDKSDAIVRRVREAYKQARTVLIFPRLLVALGSAYRADLATSAGYSLLEGASRVAAPVVLGLFLQELQDPASPAWRAYLWAGVLCALNVLQLAVHHVLFLITYRNGCNFKNAATALIFDSLLLTRASALSGTSAGTLVNLISNDVSRYEDFLVFFHFGWEAIFELGAILVLLALLLNWYAALAGVGVTLFFIPVQIAIAKSFARVRTQTARRTDVRIRQLNETVDGIGSVKAYGWEEPFFQTLGALRRAECRAVRRSQLLRCVNWTLYFCIPPLAGFALFSTYWASGGALTLPKVFSSISLLQVLRTAMGRMWTRAMETGSEAVASSARIDKFLALGVGALGGGTALEAEAAAAAPTANASDGANGGANSGGEYAALPLSEEGGEGEGTRGEGKGEEGPLLSVGLSSFSLPGRAEAVLRDIQLCVRRGELLLLLGSVGAGKSCLFSAILGELERAGGGPSLVAVQPAARVAYCAQRPWILAGSVRANITLAGELEAGAAVGPETERRLADLYGLAVGATSLSEDFSAWPFGDATEIGERGVSISGGQKARVALARAVYSDAALVLLDDPLAGVDAAVGAALLRDCVLGALRARGKGVVLATHRLQLLPAADAVLVLGPAGTQVFYGSPAELMARAQDFPFLDLPTAAAAAAADSVDATAAAGADADAETNNNGSVDCEIDDKAAALPPLGRGCAPPAAAAARCLASTHDVLRPTAATADKPLPPGGAAGGAAPAASGGEKGENVIIQQEEQTQGVVTLRTYLQYLSAGGAANGTFALAATVLGQLLAMACDYWPRWWAGEAFGDQDRVRYVWIYAALVGACLLAGLLKSLSWFSFSLRASRRLHVDSLWALLHAPLQFFVANPTGRILNRFSKDQNVVDEQLPVTSYDFLQSFSFCVAAVVLVCVAIPYLAVIVPPLLFSFAVLRARYLTSSRECKRIEAVTRSPVYAGFSAALEGLATIRAYKLEGRLRRGFRDQVDQNIRAWWSFQLLSRWLGLRLDMQTATILALTVFPAAALKGSLDIGLVGFALVYVLNLSALFQWTVRQSAEIENQMTSVERIQAYAALPPEEGYAAGTAPPESPIGDPLLHRGQGHGQGHGHGQGQGLQMTAQEMATATQGAEAEADGKHLFEIRNLTVSYRPDLPPVLCGVSLAFPLGSKVGVCGRTGSGKSSLLLALLRLNLVQAGDVLCGGASLLAMPLEAARARLSVVPQEPHLFSGTVRSNVDPLRQHSDAAIWAALGDAHIQEHCRRDPLGLSALVSEGGSNFSVGQRQLISLSRAILRRAPVVLMDEVTAAIDYQTDRLIQATIRSSPALTDATIITIAHRLRTIADSDYIAVIDAGRLAEFGSPAALLARPDSLFRALALETSEFEAIERAVRLGVGVRGVGVSRADAGLPPQQSKGKRPFNVC
jgi:ATP-binding cassette subfamily C (CFTR/MRP) protein 4